MQLLLQHVVAEVHDEVVVAEEVAGDQNAVREAERIRLRDVRELDAELRAVAERGLDLGAALGGDDHADVLDARRGHVLDHVEQDGLVRDRDELLGARVGDRPQPGAGAARQDQALHMVPIATRMASGRRARPGDACAAVEHI